MSQQICAGDCERFTMPLTPQKLGERASDVIGGSGADQKHNWPPGGVPVDASRVQKLPNLAMPLSEEVIRASPGLRLLGDLFRRVQHSPGLLLYFRQRQQARQWVHGNPGKHYDTKLNESNTNK